MFQQIAKCVGLLVVGSSLWACSATAPSEEASASTTTEAVTAPAPLSCDTAACCPAGTTPLTLTNNSDVLNNATANRCIVALGGSDTIFSSGANSAVLAGDGDDTIMAGAGALVRGGAGRDTINGFSNGTVYGGFGDDVIYSGNGNNFVVPGPGLDNVSCGTGDDTVAIYDLCEVTAGEQLAGGTGNNTLITPVPLAQLQARGVSVTGFQKIVVQQNSCKSECVTGNQCSGRGTCIEGSTTGQFKCDCPIGFSGKQCEIVGEPQLPPAVPSSLTRPIPGYLPGSLACPTPLVFDNANAANFARKVMYRVNPPPGCDALFCAATTSNSAGPFTAETPLPKPTEAQFNAPVSTASSCPATAAKTGSDCAVLAGTVQNTCFGDADCATGLVCARVCSSPACTTSERRCAKPADSCAGQPSETSCDDAGFRLCEDQAPGTSTANDYAAPLAPVVGTPAGQQTIPDPVVPIATLAAYDRCIALPAQPNKLVAQDSPWQQKDDGSNQFGVYMKPQLTHSASFTPIGLGETTFQVNVAATLTSGVKLFGKSFNAIVADAHAKLANCQRDVAATVTVFGDELVATPGAAVDPSLTGACTDALSAWKDTLEEVEIANAQARLVVNQYTATGPSQAFCTYVQTVLRDQEKPGAVKEFFTTLSSAQLDCVNDLPNAGRLAVNALVEHYRTVRQQSLDAFTKFSNLRSVYAGGQTFKLGGTPNPFNVVGGEADFPIGPVTLTIDGELFGDWGLGGQFTYNFTLGTSPNIGGTAEIGPFVHLNASIFAGVGIPGVSIGVEGRLRLIGVAATANVGMNLQGQFGPDTRAPGPWAGDAIAGFPDKIVSWQAPWEYGAGLHIDSLSGEFDLAARVHLFFYSHTFRKRLFSWNGFSKDFDLTVGGAAGKKDSSNFGQFADPQVVTEVPMLTPTTPITGKLDSTTPSPIHLPGDPCPPPVK